MAIFAVVPECKNRRVELPYQNYFAKSFCQAAGGSQRTVWLKPRLPPAAGNIDYSAMPVAGIRPLIGAVFSGTVLGAAFNGMLTGWLRGCCKGATAGEPNSV